MNHEKRIDNLQADFGYTERQARFLVQAAEHSGYFLRRQFRASAGGAAGGFEARLIRGLLRREHARLLDFTGTHLVHLCARPFYRAVGLEHSRNRRRRRLPAVRVKIMALDAVLQRPGRYLAAESEKLKAFESMGIARADLPVRVYHSRRSARETRRWFVDKFPLRLDGDKTPVFSFMDPGYDSHQPFRRHLFAYERLLRALDSFRLLYVCPCADRIRLAAQAFGAFAQSGPDDLHELARLEDLLARNKIAELGQKGLDRLRRLRTRYGTQGPVAEPGREAICGSFSSLHLRHDYSLFDRVSD